MRARDRGSGDGSETGSVTKRRGKINFRDKRESNKNILTKLIMMLFGLGFCLSSTLTHL